MKKIYKSIKVSRCFDVLKDVFNRILASNKRDFLN